jgi:hypothetical protein
MKSRTPFTAPSASLYQTLDANPLSWVILRKLSMVCSVSKCLCRWHVASTGSSAAKHVVDIYTHKLRGLKIKIVPTTRGAYDPANLRADYEILLISHPIL